MISLLSNDKVSLTIKLYKECITIHIFKTNINDQGVLFNFDINISNDYHKEVQQIVHSIILYTYNSNHPEEYLDIDGVELPGVDYSFISKFKQLELKSKMDSIIESNI